MSVLHTLSSLVGNAFQVQGLAQELGAVRFADRPDLAQFQCNGALAAAKQAGKPPRTIAEEIVAHLKNDPAFEKLEIAGPGFINITVTADFLAQELRTISDDARLGLEDSGKGQNIIVDYGGPNAAKAMHVGHLRPTIIGDCIKRIVRAAGYNALGDVHIGDSGLPMGQILSELHIRFPDLPFFDDAFSGEYPDDLPFTYPELQKIYPEASQACKDDPARLEVARQAAVDLLHGREGYVALWQRIMVQSRADMKKNFDSVGVHFELWKSEADVYPLIPELTDILRKKGVLEESQGALIVPVAEESDNKEMPPLIFLKSNEGVTYGTTDMATIYDRMRNHDDLAALIYVTDKRQNLHFEQLFRAAAKADMLQDTRTVHIGYGTMNGPDNKPFKTRDGGVMRFDQLVDTAIDKARERLKEADLGKDFSANEQEDIARKIGIAALKFADLSNQAHVDYIFDLDRMSALEGKTGPYLLYQGVRIKSLLRKAENAQMNLEILEVPDVPLVLLLLEFPEIFARGLRDYAPHHLCDYAFRLAQGFSTFYGNCHILSEENAALKQSRLALCALTYRVLEECCDLLGMEIPERM